VTAAATTADGIVAAMERCGVRTVFGIPGLHISHLYEALSKTSGIRHVLMRHEQGAGFAADGYARVSGEAGVCVTTTGPGATNTLTPLMEAYADSIPVVVLAGQIDADLIGLEKGLLHEISDQAAMFEPVTKRAERPRTAAAVTQSVAVALADATAGRPRPCYVELPTDLLAAEQTAWLLEPEIAPSPAIDAAAVGCGAVILGGARRPVIVAGGGALWNEAPAAIVKLAELLSAPVLTTVQGNGVIDGRHPLSAGCINPDTGGAPWLLGQADAVLVVGSQLDGDSTTRWTLPLPGLVRIDIDPTEITRNYAPAVAIIGDAQTATTAITAELADTRSEWGAAAAERARQLTWDSVGPAFAAEVEMMRSLRQAAPDDTIMVSDQGIVNSWTAWFWPAYQPRSQLFPWGGATLGYGLPAAIGAAAAAPAQPILLMAGDGGFMFTANELATCAKYGLNITIVVANNSGYGSIAYGHRSAFGHDGDTALLNPDFVALSASFGIPAHRVHDLADVAAHVDAGLQETGPSLIEVDAPIRLPWT
jgi:acetolactate synthase-1/2/3 large subunit